MHLCLSDLFTINYNMHKPKKKIYVRTMKKTVKKHKKKPSSKVYLQKLSRWMFSTQRPSCGAVARKSNNSGSSTSKRLRKTPRTAAASCLGLVRVGQDGKTLYIARPHTQRNPRYKGSSTSTGRGYHIIYRWDKVYDQKTGKLVKVKDLPSWLPAMYA